MGGGGWVLSYCCCFYFTHLFYRKGEQQQRRRLTEMNRSLPPSPSPMGQQVLFIVTYSLPWQQLVFIFSSRSICVITQTWIGGGRWLFWEISLDFSHLHTVSWAHSTQQKGQSKSTGTWNLFLFFFPFSFHAQHTHAQTPQCSTHISNDVNNK